MWEHRGGLVQAIEDGGITGATFYVTVFDGSVICRHDYPQLALWATNMASALPTRNADRLRPPCKACNTLYKVNKVYSVTDEPLKQPFILLHFDSDRF